MLGAVLSTLVITIAGLIWVMGEKPQRTLMMNCSSELFDRARIGEHDSYLLVDLNMQGNSVQLNYRYFDTQGKILSTVAMSGELKSVSAGNRLYTLNMHKKQESVLVAREELPSHFKYISYISGLNTNDKGNQGLSVEILDKDDTNDYAIVLFQPSNTVCGCRLMQ